MHRLSQYVFAIGSDLFLFALLPCMPTYFTCIVCSAALLCIYIVYPNDV